MRVFFCPKEKVWNIEKIVKNPAQPSVSVIYFLKTQNQVDKGQPSQGIALEKDD